MTLFTPSYAIILLVTSVVSALLGFEGWARRKMPGGFPFCLLMTAVTAWAVGGAIEAAVIAIPLKIVLAKFEYIGIVSVSPLWLLFALSYTRRDRWLRKGNIAALWVIPGIVFLLAATNELHHLIWTRIAPVSDDPGAFLVYTHGIGAWLNMSYSYALLALGTIFLLRTIFRSPKVVRKQGVMLVVGALFPWLGNVVYMSTLVPLPGVDFTPVAFMVSGLCIAWSIFRYRLFDLVPVAHFALIRTMSDAVLVLDPQNRIAEINPTARELMNISASMIGRPIEDALQKTPRLSGQFLELIKDQGERIVSCPPEGLWFDVRTSFLTDRRGTLNGRLIVLRDITALKRAEEEQAASLDRIQKRETRLRFITENMVDVIMQIDAETKILFVSPSVRRLFGYEIPDLLGRTVASFTYPEDLARVQREYRGAVEAKAPSVRLEYRARKADGSYVWIESEVQIIYDGGVYAGAIFSSRDMSIRKNAEDALRNSLQEKEILLKEIHHRVRNNMQIISSLLNHQSRLVRDPAVLEMFRESQNRIRSIAMVHERLYRSTDLSRIDFADYIDGLVVHLFNSLQVDPKKVRPRTEIEAIELDITLAIPLGLIVNELITNALKHAFPGARRGEVFISFKRTPDGGLRLAIKDDGVGVPEEKDFKRTGSLGLQIVRMLVEQVDGRFDVFSSSTGTEMTLAFLEPKKAA